MEMTEQQKIQAAKMEAMRNLVNGIAVDFEPVLNKIKLLAENTPKKEEICHEVDTLLTLIRQLKGFSEKNRKEK